MSLRNLFFRLFGMAAGNKDADNIGFNEFSADNVGMRNLSANGRNGGGANGNGGGVNGNWGGANGNWGGANGNGGGLYGKGGGANGNGGGMNGNGGRHGERRDASKLMREETFWRIIGKSDRGQKLWECLSVLSDGELIGFEYWWRYFINKAYRQDLWAVAYVVLGGCSDDGFEYFRNWLVAQGEGVYMAALEDADSLCDVFVAPDDADDADYPEQEDLGYAVESVLTKRKGSDDYYYGIVSSYEMPETLDDIEFEWEEDDEESIREVCPRTFDKWWDNDGYM